ncbi:GTP 3',8-cyclase MoaA [Undibacterium flavidum]|uniref:GTP 3',8-cyclase n=1 Tax=Undibacterium flavidum TaxID=2762297 RepID=A0ABR6YD63_9BURK|nr:GTP 3',8-cyclase MoaA [Undibacterium flavidum]MBC3874492.1 GTP 3',8-cyclase MoaA [Undibacterium flavidum]
MSDKFIPIQATSSSPNDRHVNWDTLAPLREPSGLLQDRLHRPLHDLRISVTDRCNFRCTYCMPKEIFNKDYVYLPQTDLLSFEEILRIASMFVAHGVNKIRLTGGEPLLRKNLEELVQMLSTLKTNDGQAIDLTLTTNAALLAKKAQSLKDAGLSRITVSLDALNDRIFKQMNDVDFPVEQVLEGIQAAEAAGFHQIKINMVVKKSVNAQEIIPMARYFKDTPHILRFIEFMDVGSSNGWRMDEVMTSQQILQDLEQADMPLIALAPNSSSETATRYRHANDKGNDNGKGEIGFISSVSKAFCRDCSRARLSTQGMLYTCLFATQGHDLRQHLRNPELQLANLKISNLIKSIWETREDRYSELRGLGDKHASPLQQKIEMSYIGG